MPELSSNIIDYISAVYGKEYTKEYSTFASKAATSYIRLSTFCDNKKDLINRLNVYGVTLKSVPKLQDTYKVIHGNEIIGKTIEFIMGAYYIQSLSSMVPPIILSPGENDIVLDLCAAPGSKTTQLGELMNNRGTLIANEPGADRLKMLVHNIDKTGLINTGVTQSRGEWLSRFYNNYFNKVLVDAPCSALGVVQKKGEVSNWWSKERVELLSRLQLMLISSAIKMVKVGGEVVYSTCTLTPEENELIIDHIAKKYSVKILKIDLPVESINAFTKYNGEELDQNLSNGKRILPWKVDSDGFFIIKLKKIDEIDPSKPETVKPSNAKIVDSTNKLIRNHLLKISNIYGIEENTWEKFKFILKGTDISFVDANWKDDRLGVFNRVGTKFGTFDKYGNVFLHSSATQILKRSFTKNIFEITDTKDLKTYISGGVIRTAVDRKIHKIIKYQNYILGTAAPVENGLKSQFPKSKRMNEVTYY